MADPPTLRRFHRMARTYGRMPHELLTLTPWEVAFNEACLDEAERWTAEECGDGTMAVLDRRR